MRRCRAPMMVHLRPSPAVLPAAHAAAPAAAPAAQRSLLEDNTKWQGSGKSISMDMPHLQGVNSNKKKRRTHISKSASDNDTLDNPGCNTAVWQPAKSREDLVHIANNHNEGRLNTEQKPKTGKEHIILAQRKRRNHIQARVATPMVWQQSLNLLSKGTKRLERKQVGRAGKRGQRKVTNSAAHSPPCAMSPPMGPHYLDVPYRSDRRLYLGKSSTLPAQENTTPGRCADMATLPGGATPTHTHHQRWSNPGDSSPAWGTIQHTCRRPLTEYRMYSHDFTSSPVKEWEERQQQEAAQDDSVKQDCKPPISPNIPRSMTDVDLSEPNVSST
ncbi:uncharacterized protein LOC115017758 [Cottoperca gobio]|uniref:Uncharacterized protein LOC115017758 n=1 Tax=Cottoperca gobio TaxID=56716 RepID=A0A6J2QX11_COTGO|nr:uncharacterized protein LOC115017758 [Cottoperca gobio]